MRTTFRTCDSLELDLAQVLGVLGPRKNLAGGVDADGVVSLQLGIEMRQPERADLCIASDGGDGSRVAVSRLLGKLSVLVTEVAFVDEQVHTTNKVGVGVARQPGSRV